jgi:hypothetical protein
VERQTVGDWYLSAQQALDRGLVAGLI